MNVGSVPDPLNWTHWPQAEAFLEPARALGGFERIIEPDEALWVAMDGDELLGAVTARLCGDFVEVPLIGGRDHLRWIPQLDAMIGAAGLVAGATEMRGYGRRGWTKTLRALGWDVMGEVDGMTIYRRELSGSHRMEAGNRQEEIRIHDI